MQCVSCQMRTSCMKTFSIFIQCDCISEWTRKRFWVAHECLERGKLIKCAAKKCVRQERASFFHASEARTYCNEGEEYNPRRSEINAVWKGKFFKWPTTTVHNTNNSFQISIFLAVLTRINVKMSSYRLKNAPASIGKRNSLIWYWETSLLFIQSF